MAQTSFDRKRWDTDAAWIYLFAFAGEDAPLGGRLGILCQQTYERADHPGYLEMGVPVHYGSGAAEVMRELWQNPAARSRLTTESLRLGDIERALMEWRSLLRHIV